MAKLYFKYGAMGSSKSAQALITQFNYEERGMTVWLIKPSIDDRDGADIVKSRVGLFREADVIAPEDDLLSRYQVAGHKDVIIADEAQFLTLSRSTNCGRSWMRRTFPSFASACGPTF